MATVPVPACRQLFLPVVLRPTALAQPLSFSIPVSALSPNSATSGGSRGDTAHSVLVMAAAERSAASALAGSEQRRGGDDNGADGVSGAARRSTTRRFRRGVVPSGNEASGCRRRSVQGRLMRTLPDKAPAGHRRRYRAVRAVRSGTERYGTARDGTGRYRLVKVGTGW